MIATRVISYAALNDPFHDMTVSSRFSQGNGAAKTGATLLHRQAFQLLLNQTKTFWIGCVSACKARRVDSWGTAERIDLQARVISKREHARSLGIGQGFQFSIFRKRGAGLLNIDVQLDIVQLQQPE